MASEGEAIPQSATAQGSSAAAIVARQDRIPIWSLSYLFIGIIGIGFLFTFFDIFDVTVSFVQTCLQIVHGCTPPTSANYLGLPIELNLAGYVVGALILAPLADRFGRRNMLLFTLLLTGLGSLYNAFVPDYTNFIVARTITGLGIGADLALVNAYINEVAPSSGRAKFTSLIFIMSSLGAFFGIWLGLILTTPPAPFPLGLSFAIAGPAFEGNGWRIMYGIGALLALAGILLRVQLPESPRWLIARGRTAEAETIVAGMEARARKRMPDLPAPAAEIVIPTHEERIPYTEIFNNPLYLRRTLLLVVVWFLGYVTVYSIAQGLTVLLDSLHYPPPESGMIAAFGTFGFILTAIFAYYFGESLERKLWLPIAAALTLIGGLLLGLAGSGNFGLAAIGAIITFFGFNLWVPITYTWSTENYPTRARATGFALVDGIGHLGGGIGILVIAPLIPSLVSSLGLTTGPVVIFVIISAFLIVAAVIAQFGVATRQMRLDEVSP
jgi:MFS family permease